MSSHDRIARCDDGSDDSLVTPKIAGAAVLRGIGKFKTIKPVHLLVALRKGEDSKPFTFSHSWTVPRTALHLSSGLLALVNVTYLVADDTLNCEDLLIGRPVLLHLQVDSRTLLENNRSLLDGTDCSQVGNPTASDQRGLINRIMVARINRISNDDVEPLRSDRAKVNHFRSRNETVPFPDPSLLDPIDVDQHGEIRHALETKKKESRENGLLEPYSPHLDSLLDEFVDIFRTSLSAGPSQIFLRSRLSLSPMPGPCGFGCEIILKSSAHFGNGL